MRVTQKKRMRIAVVGPAKATRDLLRLAEDVGREVARSGAVLLCGGLGGCMEAAARGARREGGLCIGVLPGYDSSAANPSIDLPLPTGLGEARNTVVVAAADGVVAVGGGAGTLSEIAWALKLKRPVVGLRTWRIRDPDSGPSPLPSARSAPEAVRAVLLRIRKPRTSG